MLNDYCAPQYDGETGNEFLHRHAISEALILILVLNESRALAATGDAPLRELIETLDSWSQDVGSNVG